MCVALIRSSKEFSNGSRKPTELDDIEEDIRDSSNMVCYNIHRL